MKPPGHSSISQFGFIGLNAKDDEALDVVAIQGFFPSEAFYNHNHLIPLRPNIFARVVLENRSVRSDDATSDPQRVGQPDGHPPVGAFLGVPLRIQDRPIGMIGVANRPEPYDDEHEQHSPAEPEPPAYWPTSGQTKTLSHIKAAEGFRLTAW